MNKFDERGDLWIDIEDIHPRMAERIRRFGVAQVTPDTETGILSVNLSSYIRYVMRKLHDE